MFQPLFDGGLAPVADCVRAVVVVDDAGMYRRVGELLVQTEHGEARDDLEEKVESLEIRMDTLQKQEERVQEQFEELQTELQNMLQGGGGPGGVGGPGAGGA